MISIIVFAPLLTWLLPASLPATAPAQPRTPLRLQVLLDRAHFSPGEIDGVDGSNQRRAVASFARARVASTAGLDEAAGQAQAVWLGR